jgi:hypothetical protein
MTKPEVYQSKKKEEKKNREKKLCRGKSLDT